MKQVYLRYQNNDQSVSLIPKRDPCFAVLQISHPGIDSSILEFINPMACNHYYHMVQYALLAVKWILCNCPHGSIVHVKHYNTYAGPTLCEPQCTYGNGSVHNKHDRNSYTVLCRKIKYKHCEQ